MSVVQTGDLSKYSDPERKAFFYQPQDDSEPVEEPAPSPFDQPMDGEQHADVSDISGAFMG
jgi:hypothetical protein